MIKTSERRLVCGGLGGISQGWLPPVLLLQQTGTISFREIVFIDGKQFNEHNRPRQHFHQAREKAEELCEMWRLVYQNVPLFHFSQYITSDNVAKLITDGAVVLLSPDNHQTRKVVSGHAERLKNILLIAGGNDAIGDNSGGTVGTVIVHYKVNGKDLTPPITRYHREIAEPTDKLPTEVGCTELAPSQPQLLMTNLLVGQQMASQLYRYCTLPDEQARQLVEVWVDSVTGDVTPYGIDERLV